MLLPLLLIFFLGIRLGDISYRSDLNNLLALRRLAFFASILSSL